MLLKKTSLNPLVFNNFRPIYNLPFMSKILEKPVASQLISLMNNSRIFEKYQSSVCADHSTETALIKISNCLLTAADSGTCAIQILLDFSSAFYRVNLDILLNPLENYVDIKDTDRAWFNSYIADRSLSVAMREFSHLQPLSFLVCLKV